MTLGEKLKKLRKDKDLTRKDAAAASGVSYNTYSAYEDGKRTPRKENYEKLAALFGCTVDFLQDDAVDFEPAGEKAEKTRKREPRQKKAKAVRVELQYGEHALDMEALTAKAREIDAETECLYVKPEEGMAYYVAGDRTGSFELF